MNTHEFISKLTSKKISDNLDPVLIYDFSNEVNKVKKLPKLPEHYCIIYAIRKEEILSAVVKSGRSYEEIMNFLNAGSDGEKTEK